MLEQLAVVEPPQNFTQKFMELLCVSEPQTCRVVTNLVDHHLLKFEEERVEADAFVLSEIKMKQGWFLTNSCQSYVGRGLTTFVVFRNF